MTCSPAARADARPEGESSKATADRGEIRSRLSARRYGSGWGLADVTSSLAMIVSKASAMPADPRTVWTFSRQVPDTTASRDAPLELSDERRDSRVETRRAPHHLDGQRLLAPHPFVDLDARDAPLAEEIGQEDPVVDFGRSSRHLIGHLPSQRGQGPLPGGDVMVVGFRDHTVEIEENGFESHACWPVRHTPETRSFTAALSRIARRSVKSLTLAAASPNVALQGTGSARSRAAGLSLFSPAVLTVPRRSRSSTEIDHRTKAVREQAPWHVLPHSLPASGPT